MFILYQSNVLQNQKNNTYKNEILVDDEDVLREVVQKDYVCAEYTDGKRSNDNFLGSDCLAMDIDNDRYDTSDGSYDEKMWVTPADIEANFPGVEFAIQYSKSNMKDKKRSDGTIMCARPRFHVLFPIDRISSAEEYRVMKEKTDKIFPFFDLAAMDAARLFFGTQDPQVEWHEGSKNLTEFIAEQEKLDALLDSAFENNRAVILEGSRNSTMHRFAVTVLKSNGDNDQTYEIFVSKNERCCQPPLGDAEMTTIWNSALQYYRNHIKTDPNYIPPEVYHSTDNLKPIYYSDLGQAMFMKEKYSRAIRHNRGLGFLLYMNGHWVESDAGARRKTHQFFIDQYEESVRRVAEVSDRMKSIGLSEMITATPAAYAKMKGALNQDQLETCLQYEDAKAYQKFAFSMQNKNSTERILHELAPEVEVDINDLDSDPYLLNTPAGTFDLRKGLSGLREHDPEDYITNITAVSPSEDGAEMWDAFLKRVFCDDEELINYVQLVCGLGIIGEVKLEALILAYGPGGNGKSTFWNAIRYALGTYKGGFKAAALTTGYRQNTSPELAELRGKRLVIASETTSGLRLDDGVLKVVCSTDPIRAEKKYKDPFEFIPSHNMVLFTNHLPRVSESDKGTWRRLIVVPFDAKFEGKSDIKNYASVLYQNAGGAILSWMIEGAQKAIKREFRFEEPQAVKDATEAYREDNDWLGHFINDECIIDESATVDADDLFTNYCLYCESHEENTRHRGDFRIAVENAGFRRVRLRHMKDGIREQHTYYKGLRLKVNEDLVQTTVAHSDIV